MNTAEYLERIGLSGPIEPTLDNLHTLQKAHLFSVPYENLDILAGKPIVLEAEALYDKIVRRRRGGYCFELNELFGWLLRALGYEVIDSFGRFLKGETGIPMRRHHVLLVCCPGDEARERAKDDGVRKTRIFARRSIGQPMSVRRAVYLADVGVGSGSPTYPMRLRAGEELSDGRGVYRLRTDDFLGWVLEEEHDQIWRDVYSFTEEKQLPVDFVAASFYCEKSPHSLFNKAPMISLRTETGRRTRDGDEFRVFDEGGVQARVVTDAAEREKLMRDWFGL